MLGVLPEAREAGLGVRLKLEQRRAALGMGLDLIEWTYDPMQAVNAHLNFSRLGVVVSEYEENIYGESSSPLHRGSPTDRFVAEWWLATHRVEYRIAQRDDAAREAVSNGPLINRTIRRGAWLECADLDLHASGTQLAVEIPMGFGEMQEKDPARALAWRMATRQMFTTYFQRGYRAVDFLIDRPNGLGRYVLELSRRPG
jgi:predicted GNAT superfamily acetyltransferase